MNNDPSGNIFVKVWRFYADGFRQMTVGRYLWAMIIIKVVILFFVFKLFFFPDRLAQDYDTDAERADAVRQSLIQPREGARGITDSDFNNRFNIFRAL